MYQSLKLAGLGASLAINAYRMLKLLELSIKEDYYSVSDRLCGLSRELRFIARNNVLEELKLDVVVDSNASWLTESEDWSAFDSVLTESGAFPMLHRVSVKIWWCTTISGNPDDCHAMLESLKEVKFSRLVESKAVEFNLCDEIF